MSITTRIFIVILSLLMATTSQLQESSLSWSLQDDSTPLQVDATALEDSAIVLRLHGGFSTAPKIKVECQNQETQEVGSLFLNPLVKSATNDDLHMTFDLASQWMGLPYPTNPWALESKVLAIISQRAEHSPYHMTEAEIREEFAWTTGYMLETARHSYELPFGDGLLNCVFRADELGLQSQPLTVQFGRGLPDGVYARDFSMPEMSDWPTWVIDADYIPNYAVPDQAELQEEIDTLLKMQSERTQEQIALIRKWDDGSAIGPWIEIAMSSVIDGHVNPPRAARVYGLVSVAMNDSLVAASRVKVPGDFQSACELESTLEPVMPDCEAMGYFSEHAVVAGAASTVLQYLLPDQADLFAMWAEEAVQAQLRAGTVYPSGIEASLALGHEVGMQIVAWAEADGSDAVFAGTIPEGDNYWIPEAPAFDGPAEPLTGTWHTWNLASPDQFRPPPPPVFGTPEHQAAALEVYEVSQNLSLEEEQIASFWEDKVGTFTPSGHWNAIALKLVQDKGLSTAEAARVFATLGTAQEDAFIAAWDSKYVYWSVRPITVIHRTIDSGWNPYVYTPPFPSYISGHATTSGAASTVLANLFPDHYEQLIAWGEEGAMSRLYGGIHYRFDNDAGLAVGRQIAWEALKKIGLSAS